MDAGVPLVTCLVLARKVTLKRAQATSLVGIATAPLRGATMYALNDLVEWLAFALNTPGGLLCV